MTERTATVQATETDPALGIQMGGRYRLLGELGRGGMGAVYRAVDEGSGRVVALKVVTSQDPREIALFEQEYRRLSKLTHLRVIQVYDFGVLRDRSARYYTMELLQGRDLVALAPLPWARACAHLRDVCTSLALLHAQRLVHRDVNPRNVRLDETGRAKLLDFGAVAPFGVASDVVGAPASVAPEVVYGRALDGRTDLFSLGVLAYWSITRRLPFPVERLRDAEAAWKRPVLAPSCHVPEVPAALDALLGALLSVDPLGRPASAADVIDRLGAIAALDDEPWGRIAESHVASAPFVGRTAEQARVGSLLAEHASGRGAVLDVHGAPGSGKTRMLAELRIEAQLAGLTCLRLPGAELARPDALVTGVARGLHEVAPCDLATGHEAARAALERARADSSPPTSEQDRTELHARIVAAVLDLSRVRPLLLAIDDAHRLDEADVRFMLRLAEAARACPLLLAVARDERAGAAALSQLASLGTTLQMAPLTDDALQELVRGVFGEVQHRGRLAQWLATTSRGHPGALHARLRELVARQVVRYVGGTWILPSDLTGSLALPALREQASMRLDASVIEVAQVLALERGALSELLIARLVPHVAAREVHAALEQLVAEQVVERRAGGYALSQESLRGELLAPLGAPALARMHRRLAEALGAEQPGPLAALAQADTGELAIPDLRRGIRIGTHLLQADRPQLGIALVRNAAIELTVRGEGLSEVVEELEAATALLRRQGTGTRAYGAPMAALTLAGMYAEWRLSYRHGDEALAILAQASGLALAKRLRNGLGGRSALAVGLALGVVLFLLLPKRRVANHYRELLLGLIGIGSAVLSVCCVVQDRARARGVGELLAPLGFFPARHPVRIVHEFQRALLAHAEGDYATARERSLGVLAFVRSDAAHRALPARARGQLEGGILMLLGHIDALCTDGRAEQTIREIEGLGGPNVRAALASARAAFHGHRGECEEFASSLEEIDRLAVQAGSVWRNDMSMLRMLWSSYLLSEDLMALKRAVRQLEPLSAELPSVARLRDIIEGCYLSERGAPDEALRRHAARFEQASELRGVRALQEHGAHARLLRKAGRAGEARALCEHVLAGMTEGDRAFTVVTFALHAELALSLAALHEDVRAAALSEQLLAEQARHENPMLRGLGHAVRAQVALAGGQREVFTVHLDEMRRWFQRTRNPALVSQVQRLAELARARWGGAHEGAPGRSDSLAASDPLEFETESLGDDA